MLWWWIVVKNETREIFLRKPSVGAGISDESDSRFMYNIYKKIGLVKLKVTWLGLSLLWHCRQWFPRSFLGPPGISGHSSIACTSFLLLCYASACPLLVEFLVGFLIATPEVTAGPQVIGRSFSSAWDHFQEGPQKSSIMTSACTRGCEIFAPEECIFHQTWWICQGPPACSFWDELLTVS